MIDDINEFYFENVPIDFNIFKQMTDLLSDAWFVYGIVKAAKIQSRASSCQTFFYV